MYFFDDEVLSVQEQNFRKQFRKYYCADLRRRNVLWFRVCGLNLEKYKRICTSINMFMWEIWDKFTEC